ncbi:3-oxoadipyl-CoA thiolase [Acinetobacter bereziniae]|uniref:3-oxoadipyl-CoA thiolase n=1 Tax=Acinetobacter TaxID=469 RepID=UPI000EF69A8B|nr:MULTISPECIES: 3-oxoadipyl-CoA thiolase [Acinetobacter]MBJ8420921.1 3-oxoadipyl-CoA thiolase [Acinetobacter bereziniae]MCU4476246.1 3-oxoadipyl-CoA thiolase [Acinetobacter bereziniae]MCU4541219.1 3-oxoadipyl-CoA thiolase [Acinetobacter bereziniae]MCU4624786.1 3-oxoadipyl-CoA thiolase [Acinetobacter bereziniae]BCX72724.1 3-oxoadipyl-CoA/3-oxo-5,6-dehydrosuberyl-CoA thiolase [Acinetobacter sp. Tol 5]
MEQVFICDAIRTPIGRYAGALSSIRTDDLAALPIQYLKQQHPTLAWDQLDELILGCANQAGEDNRNVARMASLLAGLPESVPAITVNRLCASGLDAIGLAARAIKSGEAQFVLAGGVESMSRAPFVQSKPETAFSRTPSIYDTTIGWRFINPKFKANFGVDSMPETAENVAEKYQISREDQDLFAFNRQKKATTAQLNGVFAEEICAVEIIDRKKNLTRITEDEHPRADTSLESLAKLKAPFRKQDGSVTAGNASGVNDGAACVLLTSEAFATANQLKPLAKIIAMASAGVEAKYMGIGPVPAVQKLLKQTGLSLDQMDVIELNEAFAAQSLAVMRELGLDDDDARVNPNGGAIALGHPLGMSGTRLVITAMKELKRRNGKYALCTMCVGVGQGVALILENFGV